MRTKAFFLVVITVILIGCKSGKRTATTQELEKVNNLVKQDTIKMVMDWAGPLNANTIANIGLIPVGSAGGNINLIGNPNYFRILGDSLSVDLPYYGEVQVATSYNPSDIGISFNGKPKVFEKTFNEKKSAYDYYFEVNDAMEYYQINLRIFPNLNTNIRVNSNQRTFISYRGSVVESDD